MKVTSLKKLHGEQAVSGSSADESKFRLHVNSLNAGGAAYFVGINSRRDIPANFTRQVAAWVRDYCPTSSLVVLEDAYGELLAERMNGVEPHDFQVIKDKLDQALPPRQVKKAPSPQLQFAF